MAIFRRGELELYYEVTGEGFPILLLAPGGMKSSLAFWSRSPWNPIEALSPHFRVIAMDQRNAGRSRGPITAADGWHTYAEDQVALLDHLRVERAHLLGGCIGGPYCLGVIERAPGRVASAVLQQPIGYDGTNRAAFHQMFDAWADELRPQRSDVSADAWAPFRSRMYDGDFVFNVSREFVAKCPVPLLVLMGNDLYHPSVTSREIAKLAPEARLVERWKEPDAVAATVATVIDFLREHTPRSAAVDTAATTTARGAP